MKKKVLTLFAVLLCALVVLNVTALADFGDFSGSSDYDFSYDYSDNDSSWSSSSSSSGSSYYDDDGYVSGDANPTRILIMALIVVVAIVYSMRTKMKNNSTSKKATAQCAERAESRANRAALTPIGEYTKIDPNFNAAALCEKASNLYVQMQNGWTAKNIESLRPYFTDALFTQMERSLQGYAQRGETNVVERIAVLDVTPLGFHRRRGPYPSPAAHAHHGLHRERRHAADRPRQPRSGKVHDLRMGSAAPDRHADERRERRDKAHHLPGLRRAARRERERAVPVLRHGDPAAGTGLGHQRHSRDQAADAVKTGSKEPRRTGCAV